jgi:hypothetical protein
MAPGRMAAASVAATMLIALAGCGSGGKSSTTTKADLQPVPPRSELDLPAGIPDRATGPAEAQSRRVINSWLRALRQGRVKRAAHFWALPSKFQNATPVLTVDSEQERIAVNLSLPCGAKAVMMGGAGDYTIVTFELTKRPGGNCGSGVGAKARGAIRVRAGKIAEWYRLPDKPGGAPLAPAPSGPSA